MSFEKAGDVLKRSQGDLIVSKQQIRKAEGVEIVRLRREQSSQALGFSSRPFVLCGLPVKKPSKNQLLHERRNGQFVLQVTGHPDYGLPFGQDRIVPIFLATLAVRQQSQTIRFKSATEMLDTFGMQQGGSQYRRLVAAFSRVFGATIFFGSDTQLEKARVVHKARFNFMQEAQIWYARDPNQRFLPGEFENVVVLSEEFYREVTSHPIPTDLEAVKVLSSSPAVLDLFMWLSYRCFTTKTRETIPLFGTFGLARQIGTVEYSRPRRFRQMMEQWLTMIRAVWPECPAVISKDGDALVIDHAAAILPPAPPAISGL